MKLAKRIYLGLLGLWLLACIIRVLIPWLGNYQTKQFISGHFYISGVESNAVTGAQPASVFAELNKRLEAVSELTEHTIVNEVQIPDYLK